MKKLISLCAAFTACILFPLTACADVAGAGYPLGIPFDDIAPGQILLFCGIAVAAVVAAAAGVIVLINKKRRSRSEREDNQNSNIK